MQKHAFSFTAWDALMPKCEPLTPPLLAVHDKTSVLPPTSSTSPSAANTASSLGRRSPLYRLLAPPSPVLV